MASFNLTTGLVSIASNLGLMRLLVGALHLHYLPELTLLHLSRRHTMLVDAGGAGRLPYCA